MATTQVDIAKAAGVNVATVTRALRNDKRISAETTKRVKMIAEAMHYRPNQVARSLITGTSGVIGVVVTPTVMPTFESIIEPIEKGLREAGYSILFFTTAGHPEGERACVEQFLQYKVDGVIAIPGSGIDVREIYQELVDAGIKLVIVDRHIDGLNVPQVSGDDYRAARLATEHLISLGHRDIVHLAIPPISRSGKERVRGFREALADAGVPFMASMIVETDFGEEAGARTMAKILKRKQVPTAVVARHDVVAIGAMHQVFAKGLSIPEDISFVGNGDIWCSDDLRVPLTTVHHPLRRISTIGVELLLDMLAGKKVEPEVKGFPERLIIRASCAPPKDRRSD